MAKKKVKEVVKKVKKEEVAEVQEAPVVKPNITFHEDRWDTTSNQLVSDKLPSLND